MATMGMQARLMSQALRKLTAILSKAKTTCLFTNQLREKVGVMFGSPETTPGGKALKFYASVRIDIRRKEAIKDGSGATIGNHVKVKIVKNQVAPPHRELFAIDGRIGPIALDDHPYRVGGVAMRRCRFPWQQQLHAQVDGWTGLHPFKAMAGVGQNKDAALRFFDRRERAGLHQQGANVAVVPDGGTGIAGRDVRR
jgi:RecA/RadA recombinase